MKKVTWLDRLRYTFDNTMSRGPAGLVIWLALVSVILILTVTLIVAVSGADPDKGFFEILWNIMYQTLTPNPVDPKAGSPNFLGGMLFVTFASLLLVSIFIGILTNAIDHRIQHLRKGRSTVVEKNHTLILGWSPQIFTIISELVEANSNHKNQCIVVLADKDKVEMEDEIHALVPHTRTTHVVCRTGSPLNHTDLEIANPHTARSIIILAPEVDDPDTHVIKTMLALVNNPNRKQDRYHIVAEIRNEKNVQVAKMVGRDEVQIILVGDLISRIATQTCRQSGLSVVYIELLNFSGDEIYFKQELSLVGKTFGEALPIYEDCTVIGLVSQEKACLNPPMNTPIKADDQIIVIAEDDDKINFSGLTNLGIDESAIQSKKSGAPAPERTLMLGWNSQAPIILGELDNYVSAGSETTVVSNVVDAASQVGKTKNQSINFQLADVTNRDVLDALNVPSFDHIIVLSYSDALDAQNADAQTLITLLHLRDMSEKAGKEFSIVSEMVDVRNRALADVTRADDFIVSDQLVSLWLAQVSENKYLNAVFADLFAPEGSEIYLKPASDYVCPGTPVNFYAVLESARRRGEIAIGYRIKAQAHDEEKTYGVVVNPDKSNQITFSESDKIILLAES